MTDVAAPVTTERPTYAVRRRQRLHAEEVRRLTAFGLLIGWIALLGGAFAWLAVRPVPDLVAAAVATTGAGLLLFAVMLPEVLVWPERVWMGLAQVMGRLVMTVLLTLVYLAWVWPLGAIQRRRRGSHPFHAWDDAAPTLALAGWERFDHPETSGATDGGANRRPLIAQMFGIVGFFASRGHWAMVPMLVLLLAIGAVLFFVSSTALAPFIYTLF